MNGLIIGGTASGVGKTIATLTVITALQEDGFAVQPAKCGPDFIDPTHHTTITDPPSRTLDLWMQGTTGVRRNYYRGTGDICVIEGVMGLYDGDVSSTAAIADTLDLPVVLVIDATASMESVAATALGFSTYADHTEFTIDIAGVIAQQAHAGRHETGIKEALPPDIPYLGRIPPNPDLTVPDRHLGLYQGTETPVPTPALTDAAQTIDTSALTNIARSPPRPTTSQPPHNPAHCTIGIALDDAFSFIYPETRRRLAQLATVTTFSPVNNDPIPDCDGVYLPGGYPELHAAALSDSQTLEDVASRALTGLPVYAECGGMLALAETLTTTDGTTHEMAGVLPLDVTMHERYQALDHTEYIASKDSIIAPSDQMYRGHEFHYSSASPHEDAQFVFSVNRGDGITGESDGITEHQTLGLYGHLHPATGAFDTFIETLETTQ